MFAETGGRRARVGRRIGAILAGSLAISVAISCHTADASFLETAVISQATVSTGLLPPTTPATAAGPCVAVTGSASIIVSWSTSARSDGYEVLGGLVSGGPYSTMATVSGQTMTNATVSGLPYSTTYYLVVEATLGAWRSPPTTQVSRITLSALCN